MSLRNIKDMSMADLVATRDVLIDILREHRRMWHMDVEGRLSPEDFKAVNARYKALPHHAKLDAVLERIKYIIEFLI